MIVSGFLLPLIESAATAIGAGMLIGTFWGATMGVVEGRSRKQVEGDSLRYGYGGALLSLATLMSEGNV